MTVSRRERVREATREEIKQAARRQIAERGAPTLSLRAVAVELGMTPPALYRYFKNRDDLVTALIVDAYNSLADHIQMRRDEQAAEAYRARILTGCMAYREWALAHPQDYALILGTPIPSYAAPAEITTPAATRTMTLFTEVIEAAYRAGQLAALAPEFANPPPALREHLTAAAAASGTLPVALHIGTVAWMRMHGMVSLELFEHVQPLIGDPAIVYQQEILNLIAQAGLSEE